MVTAPRDVLAYLRRAGEQRALVALNVGRQRAELPLPTVISGKGLTQVFPMPGAKTSLPGASITLGAEDVRVFLVSG